MRTSSIVASCVSANATCIVADRHPKFSPWLSKKRCSHSRIAYQAHHGSAIVNRRALLRAVGPAQEDSNLLQYDYNGMPRPVKDFSTEPHAPSGAAKPNPPAYNARLAEVMSRLAIHAYNRPDKKEGYCTRNIRGLPTVTVFDRKLMMQAFKGVLKVHVKDASALRPADLDGGADPYVEAFVAGSSFRTKSTPRKTLNPVWNEEHWLCIRDPECDSLVVRVVDSDGFLDGFFGRDNDLGVAVLGLGRLAAVEEEKARGSKPGAEPTDYTFKLPLRGDAGEGSMITLACRYTRFTEETGPETIPYLQERQHEDVVSTAAPISITALAEGDLKPLAYIDCQLTDTQVWLFGDLSRKQLVFSFRGTEQSVLKDVITDARLLPSEFKSIVSSDQTGVRVHRGFMRAYRSVRYLMSRVLTQLTASDSDKAFWEVTFTGHSLGGALATLAAYELGLYKRYAGRIKSISAYTFGSPRVGNEAFAERYDELVPNTWRFTNKLDIVPSVPPSGVFFHYHHVGHPMRLRGDGTLRKGLLTAEAKAHPDLAHKDVQHDVNWLVAGLSFKGLAEHDGSLYIGRLKEAQAGP